MKFLKFLTVALFSIAISVQVRAQDTKATPAEVQRIAQEAYVYAFGPVYSYRFLQDEVFNESSTTYIGAFNKIKNYQRLNQPGDTMFTPNVDTPYTRIWLDLRSEPVVVTMPKVTPENRYYVMQAISLDHYNLDFTGTRTVGQNGGPIIYVGPRFTGSIPTGIGRVVVSPTDFVYLQGRILVFNPDDMKNVIAIQNEMTIKPLHQLIGEPAPAPAEPFKPKMWTTDDKVLRSVDTLDYLAFLLPYISLQQPQEQQMLDRFARIGLVPGKPFRLQDHSPEDQTAILAGVEAGVADVIKAANSATTSVGLLGSKDEIAYNYLNRSAGVAVGIFGNSPAEAIYVGATMDKAKAGEKYILRFAPGQTPPLEKQGFWSATMYTLPDRFLVRNPINRYAIGDRNAGLKRDADGGLTIYLQPSSPGPDKEANWLPTPSEGPFMYVIRVYVPSKEAQNGTWKPPVPKLVE